MCMKRDEVPQLAIHNPSGGSVGILALDPEHTSGLVEGMKTVGDANPQTMEEDWDAPVTLLVTFKPEPGHQSCKASSDELVNDVHGWTEDRARDIRHSCRGVLSSDMGNERSQLSPLGFADWCFAAIIIFMVFTSF